MGSLLDSQAIKSYRFLLKWVVLSLLAGIVGSSLVHVFMVLLQEIKGYLDTIDVCQALWPVSGAIIAGAIIYQVRPQAAGEGLPSYIRGIRLYNGDLPFLVTFYKFLAALATLATFGNGGVVGPIGRVSAGIVSLIGKVLRGFGFSAEDQRSTAICGMAAAVGAVFHSSIGAGIFAVEIIQKSRMAYKDLFPAILSSATAVFICKSANWQTFYQINAKDEFMDKSMVLWLILLAIASGIVGGLYTSLYATIARLIKREAGNVLIKVMVGSLIAGLIAWSVNPALLGTSSSMIAAVLSGDLDALTGNMSAMPISVALLIMIAVKAICNCITVGTGMSAGFTGPSALMGMLLGAAMALLLGVEPGTATFHAFLAGGFAAMLASSMNIPLAAAVMTIEIFGLDYSFPAGLSAVIAFQITRGQTIYEYALKIKEEDDE